MYQHVLLPIDGRQASEQVAEQGLRMAREIGASVTLVAVEEHEHQVLYPPVGHGSGDQWHPVLCHDLRPMLEALSDRWRRRGVKIETVVTQGDPAEEILKIAEQAQADLIVMAAHCRGPLASLLLGSVSQAVLREATCPVQIFGAKAKFALLAPPEPRRTATLPELAEPPGMV